MRVLLITDLFPHVGRPSWGEAFVELAAALARHVQLYVLAPAYRGLPQYEGQPPRIERDGFVVEYPPCPAFPRRFILAAQAFSMAHGLGPAAWRARPWDIVHAINALPPGWAAARIAARLRAPLIVTAVGSDLHAHPRHRHLAVLLRRALSCARLVTTVSRELAPHARRWGARRVLWIPNGCRPDPTPEGARQRNRVLFVGKWSRIKGFDLLLESMRWLPGVRLVAVGGPADPDLPRMEGVEFLPALPRQQLREEMRRAWVLCLPSRREGWPLAILEGMASGLPAVATSVGGIPEIVENRSLGLLVPPGDPVALAAALRQALETDWDRAAIRAHAARYSWDRIASLYLTAYKAVRSGTAPHAPALPPRRAT